MATLTFSEALLPFAGTDARETARPRGSGLAARFVKALMRSRRRAAQREIARVEAAYGLRLRGEADAFSLRDLPF